MDIHPDSAVYQNFLRAFPASWIGRDDLNRGNRVLLPSSALAELAQGNMPQPLVFRINSMRTKKIVYCGVLEFVAPDDTCVLPDWVDFCDWRSSWICNSWKKNLSMYFLFPKFQKQLSWNWDLTRPHSSTYQTLVLCKLFLTSQALKSSSETSFAWPKTTQSQWRRT